MKNFLNRLFSRSLRQTPVGGNVLIPAHLAIIMDGNGRWAREKGLPRTAGHREGAKNLKRVTEACARRGVRYLTVYAFSTENWKRPDSEVDTLMKLFVEFFRQYDKELEAADIRLRFSGDFGPLPEAVRQTLEDAQKNSENRKGLQLIVALNYGGRREILQAAEKLRESKPEGPLTEEDFQKALYLPDVPDPELIIRTSGELRLSNFLLWQAAYAEFYACPEHWPDFDEECLERALASYGKRDRRFGGIKA